jgi:hypothetical protein
VCERRGHRASTLPQRVPGNVLTSLAIRHAQVPQGQREMEVLVILGLLVACAVAWKLSIHRGATSIKNL